jgi:hypothetical protein
VHLIFSGTLKPAKAGLNLHRNETGFHDVNRFINLLPHKYSGYQSIPDFVKGIQSNDHVQNQLNPLKVSALLHSHSDKALELLQELNPGESAELKAILHDIKTMAYLGKYYAHKISGAAHLALYRDTETKAVNRKPLMNWKST